MIKQQRHHSFYFIPSLVIILLKWPFWSIPYNVCCDWCSGLKAKLLTRELEVDVSAPVRLYTWNTSFVYPNRFLSFLFCQPYSSKNFLVFFCLMVDGAAPPVRIRNVYEYGFSNPNSILDLVEIVRILRLRMTHFTETYSLILCHLSLVKLSVS